MTSLMFEASIIDQKHNWTGHINTQGTRISQAKYSVRNGLFVNSQEMCNTVVECLITMPTHQDIHSLQIPAQVRAVYNLHCNITTMFLWHTSQICT